MKFSNDPLGDRMKALENSESSRRLIPGLPICVRLDGKAFHTFTRGLERPWSKAFHDLMVDTTSFLVKETGAVIGYTQSDEISLVLWYPDIKSQTFLDRRVLKLVSILSGYASAYFTTKLVEYLPDKAGQLAVFDCRVWNTPNKDEAVNNLIWREFDATKNSILCAAQASFSHRSLQGLDCDQLQEKLFQDARINWNDYPAAQKRGTYVQRRKELRAFSAEELDRLPPMHAAKKNPELQYERTVVQVIDMPILTKVVNRVAVVFDGATPKSEWG